MYKRRLPLFFLCVSMAVLATARGRGQSGPDSSHDYVVGVGLPGIDRALVADESRLQDSREAWVRQHGLESRAAVPDRIGPAGSRIVSGRLIVRFRDGLSTADRQAAVASASAGATMAPRPAYADFDLVQLDMTEDPEQVAR